MARVAGSVAGRRTIPGLSEAIMYRFRYYDRAFCMVPLGASCSWCQRIDRLERGEPVTVDGATIAAALFNPAAPKAWDDFRQDTGVYVVTGDRVARGD